jgi:hypothetical protein
MQTIPGYALEKAVASLTVSLVVSIEDSFRTFSFWDAVILPFVPKSLPSTSAMTMRHSRQPTDYPSPGGTASSAVYRWKYVHRPRDLKRLVAYPWNGSPAFPLAVA